ncbi:MAG: hypothetical protein KME16_12230 [Scytolyngbya sp. HA4215-MV1]|jgi:hypothetical protein|nr:hypothetical protein [Scytolyngbya sp. HA4215-MV1]
MFVWVLRQYFGLGESRWRFGLIFGVVLAIVWIWLLTILPVQAAETTFRHILPITTTRETGAGSLRSAIEQANHQSELTLLDLRGLNGTITLTQSLPKIRSNLVLLGNGNVTISGNDTVRVLYLDRGNVTLENLIIAHGLAKGEAGRQGSGGAAGMGGGVFINDGTVTMKGVMFVANQAIGGDGSRRELPLRSQVTTDRNHLEVNRGAIVGLNGISLADFEEAALPETVQITSQKGQLKANRGAIAGVNGIGIHGIGSIAFGGGGGFGGFGNAGNGGNGGNGGADGGNGGNGGDGGNGGIGIFGGFSNLEHLANPTSMGTIAFGGGGGFGGFGNAGNGGNGGNAQLTTKPNEPPVYHDAGNGGNGGNGGRGGFGGGGGSGGTGGNGGRIGIAGLPGLGGFGGGNGSLGSSGGGGGFGGAVFVRAGTVTLQGVTFRQNAAIAGQGTNPGQGKGGALFMVTEALKTQAGVAIVPKVRSLGNLTFHENMATQAGESAIDNPDVYGVIEIDRDRS